MTSVGRSSMSLLPLALVLLLVIGLEAMPLVAPEGALSWETHAIRTRSNSSTCNHETILKLIQKSCLLNRRRRRSVEQTDGGTQILNQALDQALTQVLDRIVPQTHDQTLPQTHDQTLPQTLSQPWSLAPEAGLEEEETDAEGNLQRLVRNATPLVKLCCARDCVERDFEGICP